MTMNTIYTVRELTDRWNELSCLALSQENIYTETFRVLALNTFELLSEYDSDESIPKSLSELLISMSDFAANALLDGNLSASDPQKMHEIVVTLLCQFVKGFKNCGSEYPKLKLSDDLNEEFLDFKTADLYKLFFMDDDLPF